MERTLSGLDGLDHNKNIAIALSRTIVLWSLVEISLKSLFILLACVNYSRTDGIFANITGFHAKIQILKTLITRSHLTTGQKKKLSSLVNRINRLARTRNKYVHHTWWLDESSNQTVLMNSKYRVGDQKYLTNVTAGNISNHNKAVRKWINDEARLLGDLRETSHGKFFLKLVQLQDYPQVPNPQKKNQKPKDPPSSS